MIIGLHVKEIQEHKQSIHTYTVENAEKYFIFREYLNVNNLNIMRVCLFLSGGMNWGRENEYFEQREDLKLDKLFVTRSLTTPIVKLPTDTLSHIERTKQLRYAVRVGRTRQPTNIKVDRSKLKKRRKWRSFEGKLQKPFEKEILPVYKVDINTGTL